MVVKCENVSIPWNVTDFGSITNGEINFNVINAHVRTVHVSTSVLEVIRSRICHHILQNVVALCSLSDCDWHVSTVCSNAVYPVSLIQQCLDSGQYL